MDTEAWHAELKRIVASQEFAYAMGSSCSMGNKPPAEVALLRRVEILRALIGEHEP